MMHKIMARIAFFGNPSFAVPCLRALHQSAGHEIVMVVCAPDGPGAHGQPPTQGAVKQEAASLGLPIAQPNYKNPQDWRCFALQLTALRCDLAILVAYGPDIAALLAVPQRGIVMVHASLLPRWRGAAPIEHALLAGEAETGISLVQMTRDRFAGELFAQDRVVITSDDDAQSLSERLAEAAAKLLLHHLDAILNGTLQPQPQRGERSDARPITQTDCQMDWRQSAAQCANRIRALSVRGPVKVRIKDRDVGLFCPKVSERDFHAPPGTVLRVDDQILFATTQGILSVSEVQIPGQKQRRQVSSVRDLLSNSRMTSRRSDLISAALRHRRTARLLFDTPAQDRSLDQAYHLAGFGPECARNACLSDSWAGPALGHGFSDEQAQHQDYLLTLDAHAQRYVRTNWSTKHPELVNWGVHSRYLHTGAHEYDRVKALLDASEEVVDQITLALWADGLIDDGALR